MFIVIEIGISKYFFKVSVDILTLYLYLNTSFYTDYIQTRILNTFNT